MLMPDEFEAEGSLYAIDSLVGIDELIDLGEFLVLAVDPFLLVGDGVSALAEVEGEDVGELSECLEGDGRIRRSERLDGLVVDAELLLDEFGACHLHAHQVFEKSPGFPHHAFPHQPVGIGIDIVASCLHIARIDFRV